MENQIETTLGHLVFYAKETLTGELHEIEKLVVYHSRSLAEDNETLQDYILFASPNRCNLYGDALTQVEEYDFTELNYVKVESLRHETSLLIPRNDFYIVSGVIDFLIYHNFLTNDVRIDSTLDDESNYNNALADVSDIVHSLKQDLASLRSKKTPLFLSTEEGYKRCKLKVHFEAKTAEKA